MLQATQAELSRKDDALACEAAAHRAARSALAEAQQALDNGAAVTALHCQELLEKGEEIRKLRAIVEALGGVPDQ